MLSREAHELLSETRAAFVAAGPEGWNKGSYRPYGALDDFSRLCVMGRMRVAAGMNLREPALNGSAYTETRDYLARRLPPGHDSTVDFNDASEWDDVVRLLDAALYESVCEQRAAGRYPAVAPRRWERAR